MSETPNRYFAAQLQRQALATCQRPPCYEEVQTNTKMIYAGESTVAVVQGVVDPPSLRATC